MRIQIENPSLSLVLFNTNFAVGNLRLSVGIFLAHDTAECGGGE